MCGIDLSSGFEFGFYIGALVSAICMTYGFVMGLSWLLKKAYELFTR